MTTRRIAVPMAIMLACTTQEQAPADAGSTASDTAITPAPRQDERPPAPWSAEPVASDSIASVYVTQWRKAENRATCGLYAFVNHAGIDDAKARAATFTGGWAVAFDRPDQRSAFGIAGTGSRINDDSYDDWAHKRRWRDGSSADYGPEGGTGPNQLAYMRIVGEQCLYNVWSRVSVQHLELLLDAIRKVVVRGQ